MSSTIAHKSVLVVGGCGFLGYHIVSQLLEAYAKVSVLDFKLDRNRVQNVDYHGADISIKPQVEDDFSRVRPQAVIHTASPTALSTDSALYHRANVDGTRNLLECARSIKTHRRPIDADEESPVLYIPEQKEVYSHTKALADDLVRAANNPGAGILTMCLRSAGMFGEGDINTLQKMIENAESGKNRFQIGSGKNLFDWTYVGNAAHAHILAPEALLNASPSSDTTRPRVDGETFFITNGDPMPFWDFVRAIGEAAGYPVKRQDIWVIPRSVGLTMAVIAEWVVWLKSLGKEKSTMTRGGSDTAA
ncbi:sterol-4-alpha-carboxylate 3-dehydrogenase, decarboxylating [Physcia stellaris]|nr:sterol-4-alpha-carboxylate 3-dehydrogenase, decarboxylating [Physcia stellaris]